MPKNKKEAFTLTELLVVVVIIGVLAAVVLPKFNKVVETRKTTEAEELMAAVRTEQEYRCAMDKPYIGDITKLSEIIPQAETKNFTYQLETNGILASSRSKSYDLKMPSYADGRFCCEGKACNELNKDYPKCDDLIAQPDYKVATECTADIVVAPAPDPCMGEQVLRQDCTEGCGWRTRTVTGCVDGQWQYTDWAGSCRPAKTETESCGDGYTGSKTRTEVCDKETGRWTFDGAEYDTSGCTLTCDLSKVWSAKERCEDPQIVPIGFYEIPGEGFADVNYTTPGTWNMEKCDCDCPPGYYLGADGSCVRNCEAGVTQEVDRLIENCEDANGEGALYTRGTWTEDDCSCSCPQGSRKTNDGRCVVECNKTSPQWTTKAQNCEQGDQSNSWVAGSWNEQTCQCDCPTGSKLNSEGACISSCGSEKARRECATPIPWRTDSVPGFFSDYYCRCVCDTNIGLYYIDLPNGNGNFHYSPCLRHNYCNMQGAEEYMETWKKNCSSSYDLGRAGRSTPGRWDEETCTCDCPLDTVWDGALDDLNMWRANLCIIREDRAPSSHYWGDWYEGYEVQEREETPTNPEEGIEMP